VVKYLSDLKDAEVKNVCGVYKLWINKHIYIGSSANLNTRLKQHFYTVGNGKHLNCRVQEAFNKYREIDFCILKIIDDPKDLIEWEQFYINKYRPDLNIRQIVFFQSSVIDGNKIPKMRTTISINKETAERVSAQANKIGNKSMTSMVEFMLIKACDFIDANGYDEFINIAQNPK
jgi:group I intron endonuclease